MQCWLEGDELKFTSRRIRYVLAREKEIIIRMKVWGAWLKGRMVGKMVGTKQNQVESGGEGTLVLRVGGEGGSPKLRG